MNVERTRSCRPSWTSFARVAFAIVAGANCTAMAHARVAQQSTAAEPFAAAVESAPAVDDAGLAVGIDLLNGDETQRSGSFATLGDAVLDLRWKNLGDETIDLLLDGPSFGRSSPTALLDVELLHDDGTPVERPGCAAGSAADPVPGMWFDDFVVQRVAPQEHALRRVPFAALIGVGQLALDPGIFRLRITSHGLPASERDEKQYWTPLQKHALTAWNGAARSQQLRFRITGTREPLAWSEPHDGLRVAVVVTPPERRLFTGETVRPRFLVWNVSPAPIRFQRPIAASQEDEIVLARVDGGELQLGRCLCTGYYPTFEWTLAPGGRVWIEAAPITIRKDGYAAGSSGGSGALAPGRVAVAYTLCLSDGRRVVEGEPWQYRQLRAPPFELEVLDRAGR
jgi:hypothetical protein